MSDTWWSSGHATPKYGSLARGMFQVEGIWETAGTGKIFWPSSGAGLKSLTWEAPSLCSEERSIHLSKVRGMRKESEQTGLAVFRPITFFHETFHSSPTLASKHSGWNTSLGFPGGAVVKNPPANAWDMGSIPGPGRSHMSRNNEARVPQLPTLRSRAREPQLLSPRAATTEAHAPTACAPQQEKPPQ